MTSLPWCPSSSSLRTPPTNRWLPSRTFQKTPLIAGQPSWLALSPPPAVWRFLPGWHWVPPLAAAHTSAGDCAPAAGAAAGRTRTRPASDATPPRIRCNPSRRRGGGQDRAEPGGGPARAPDRLQPFGVADGVAARGPRLGRPGPADRAPRARVEAKPGDGHVHVAAVGVDRHPGAGTGLAPGGERA